MSNWRKGCFCGCLYEAECAHYEPPADVVHVVHHHVIHDPRPRFIESEIVIGELEGSG